jgi:hypothetical protein
MLGSPLQQLEAFLITAGGQIRCLRCTARSRRSGRQCGRPALKASSTQKCRLHGALGSGPRTVEGRARIAAAHLVHGHATKAARAEQSAAAARLASLEDAMHLLQMVEGPRTRGRKPAEYQPIRTMEDLRRIMQGNGQYRKNGFNEID